ncbi:MAG: hypothetical protein FJX29_03255 [Alphaproteobacteria bacterium]|nr:hypothetical protein [Alphaproteobacteria bacterium]
MGKILSGMPGWVRFSAAFKRLFDELRGLELRGFPAEAAGRLRYVQLDLIRRCSAFVMTANVWNVVIVLIVFRDSPHLFLLLLWGAVTCVFSG